MNYCPFSKFKYIFGIPNKGVHQYIFLDTAIVDYIFTIIAAAITTYLTKYPFVLSTITWFIGGIFAHAMVGLKTNTTEWLNLRCD